MFRENEWRVFVEGGCVMKEEEGHLLLCARVEREAAGCVSLSVPSDPFLIRLSCRVLTITWRVLDMAVSVERVPVKHSAERCQRERERCYGV